LYQAEIPTESLDATPEHVDVKEVPALEMYPLLQVTKCVSKVRPPIALVSLFATVNNGQATPSQVSILNQAAVCGSDDKQVTVKETPAIEVKPTSQFTTWVENVNPVINDVSLFRTVNVGQVTASHVKTLDQAEIPGEVPEQVRVNELPTLEVYPSWHRTICSSEVKPDTKVESLWAIVTEGHATGLHVSTFDQAEARR